MNDVIVRESKLLSEKYYKVKHKSGLEIYVFPKDMSTYYAMFGTKYGSVNNKFRFLSENEYTEVPNGIAHFLEHKMFENEDGEDTFAKFARTGASANAYTSFLNTAYLFSCTENFYESLDILLDFVSSPYFTPETVEKEQGIIGQEIRMGEDNPGRALLFGLLQAMYEEHPVRIEIAGTVDSISHITSDLLYKCYNTFYNLNNMTLCVCGKVELDKVLEVVDRVLKDAEPFNVENVYPKEKPEVAERFFSKKMQVAKPIFAIGVKDVDISDDPRERMKKAVGINVICDMLFGKTGELFNDLYSSGKISQGFDCWAEHNQSFSFINVSSDSDDPNEVFDKFVEYVEEKKKNGLSKEDFERSKKVMYSSIIKSFDSTSEIVNNIIANFALDGGEIFEYTEIVGALEFEYVTSLFNSMFKDEFYSFATVYPLDN